jgi:hypothetical protein
MVITRLIEDMALWSHRIKNCDHKARIMLWRDHLSSKWKWNSGGDSSKKKQELTRVPSGPR